MPRNEQLKLTTLLNGILLGDMMWLLLICEFVLLFMYYSVCYFQSRIYCKLGVTDTVP